METISKTIRVERFQGVVESCNISFEISVK